jgi:hypothetical protein
MYSKNGKIILEPLIEISEKEAWLFLPENKEIIYAKTSFETIKRFNPTVVIKTWYKHIFLPYKQVIDSGDLSFFINKDYSEDLSIVMNSTEIINMIDNIRKIIFKKKHFIKY